MKVVEPFRNKEDIAAIKKHLLDQGLYRDYCLFSVGLNVGLRISDLSWLKWGDVYNSDGSFKTYVDITEKKTDKSKRFPLNKTCKEALELWKSHSAYKEPEQYIFWGRCSHGALYPIDRSTCYRILKREAEWRGVENIGTHSLRKSFGYWSWKNGVPIETLMQIFNHSSPEITKRYIGINRDIIDEAYESLEL